MVIEDTHPVEPGHADRENDQMGDDSGDEQCAVPADGAGGLSCGAVVFVESLSTAADDESNDWLADEKAEDVSAGLSEEGEPSAFAFCEDAHAEGSGGDIEQDAEDSESRAEGDRGEHHGEGLEGERDAEWGGRDDDLGADRKEEGHRSDREEAEDHSLGVFIEAVVCVVGCVWHDPLAYDAEPRRTSGGGGRLGG